MYSDTKKRGQDTSVLKAKVQYISRIGGPYALHRVLYSVPLEPPVPAVSCLVAFVPTSRPLCLVFCPLRSCHAPPAIPFEVIFDPFDASPRPNPSISGQCHTHLLPPSQRFLHSPSSLIRGRKNEKAAPGSRLFGSPGSFAVERLPVESRLCLLLA